MKLRKVHYPLDSEIEWRIKGWLNNGLSTQDDDGYIYIDEELEVTREEAIRIFDARIEEWKRETWKHNKCNYYERIEVSLQMKKAGIVKIVKKASLMYEELICEKVVTTRKGRGWIESKSWLDLSGSTKLKNGNTIDKYMRSQSSSL